MASSEPQHEDHHHPHILRQGAGVWNEWRRQHPDTKPDLRNSQLIRGDFRGANLRDADLSWSHLLWSDFSGADFSGANLYAVDAREANFSNANFTDADLSKVYLGESNLSGATLDGCRIYGVSAWNVMLDGTRQSRLIITRSDEPPITVDDIEVAQFVYLLRNNQKIRRVIDTITSKVVLILGRFTPERKKILEAIHTELRNLDYLPIIFDFERPASLDFIETVSTLAHMAKFVVADVTDARLVLEEVPHIVRNVAVPLKPLMLAGSGDEPLTLDNLRRNHRSVLATFFYEHQDHLVKSLQEEVVDPAEALAADLAAR